MIKKYIIFYPLTAANWAVQQCAAPQYCGEGDYGGLAQLVEQRNENP